MITSNTTPEQLAEMLGTSLKNINFVAYVESDSRKYSKFEIDKKSGGKRTINAPKDKLKNLQRKLVTLLNDLYKPHPAATAFIEGRGIVYNATKHVRKAAVFNIDLNSFYDQIHFGRVYGLLIAKPYSLKEDTAKLIANLCCANQVIPQGAPTSPVISNMICRTLDRELTQLAKNNQAQYSRYADDITFSFRSLKKNKVCINSVDDGAPSCKLVGVIERNGFSINSKKTRLQLYDQRQIVTGLKVNQKVNVDRRYVRATKAMVFALSKGEEKVNDKYQKKNKENGSSNLALMVAGRINFIRMVKGGNSTVFKGLAEKYNGLGLGFNINVAPRVHGKIKHTLPFFKTENRRRLEQCVWVVSFEGVEGVEIDEELVQGSAFLLDNQRLYTAAHVFKSAKYPEYCYVYRIFEPAIKYKAKLVRENVISDIAELLFIDENIQIFNSLKISTNQHVNNGYEVAIVGFPQLMLGHTSVSIKPCHIVNSFNLKTYEHKEVDVDIHGGNSGGPVVDGYLDVVGIARLGLTASDGIIEGTNAFISAKHIFDNLVEVPEVPEVPEAKAKEEDRI